MDQAVDWAGVDMTGSETVSSVPCNPANRPFIPAPRDEGDVTSRVKRTGLGVQLPATEGLFAKPIEGPKGIRLVNNPRHSSAQQTYSYFLPFPISHLGPYLCGCRGAGVAGPRGTRQGQRDVGAHGDGREGVEAALSVEGDLPDVAQVGEPAGPRFAAHGDF